MVAIRPKVSTARKPMPRTKPIVANASASLTSKYAISSMAILPSNGFSKPILTLKPLAYKVSFLM